ncbi:MAG: lactate transporter [Candidatus Nephthysia bennettiae]|uniref:L-lactate permease n=1 Tax=Candidatus Nephthysia bennettiae TaxID=3127016 RepID=A0A934N7L5_9BACT|nr:L-lactate permease [Candidatus Dormibacteraeota bacterium]MBJ7615079.1 L-lactate permease [Candidatus Dormibacteraeota bacterium]PZR85117.1 MAG: lactate transporter [Candidatus Dormibacteraeota bacterium]
MYLAFHQVYQPVAGSIILSALVAILPLALLFVALAVFRLPAWVAALGALASAFGLAWLVWGMGLPLTLSAATEGMAFGLWPISWVVLNAVFFHNLTVASGDFDVIRRSLARLTEDRRIQALLVAFSFGALIEGVAGFGAPVAISASILASLGFEPISAAVLALLANTAPVAFGSIGIPITTLGGLIAPILGKDPNRTTLALSAMVGRQLPIFSMLIPAYLIVILAGWRRMTQVLPAVLTAGVSFAVVQFLVSNFVGPELTDILAALVSMGSLALLLRVWKPGEVYRFRGEAVLRPVGGAAAPAAPVRGGAQSGEEAADGSGRVWAAYLLYAVLVIVILVGQIGSLPGLNGNGKASQALQPPANLTADFRCGQPAFSLCKSPWIGPEPTRDRQAVKFPVWDFYWPGSYETAAGKPRSLIFREPPLVAKASPYDLTFRWDFLIAAGSLVLYAALIAWLLMVVRRRLRPRDLFVVYGRTLRQLALPIVTIAFILGIAQVMNYSGMTSTMAIALSKTGVVFPFVSAFLGALGVFLTGSDTSSNTLFGPLQAQTAKLQGLNPILTAATNSSGGVMGKMISPQNLSVGAAGVKQVGAEGDIFRRTIGYSLVLTSLMGVLAMIQAYVLPGIIPSP